MYTESFSLEEKQLIAKSIKNISDEEMKCDFENLKNIGSTAETMSERCRIGNNFVDYYTFCERLETKGKYDANYFEFVQNIEEFKKKKFIKTMLDYYEKVKNKNNTKNKYVVLKETYNICISAINIFRPLIAMEIYARYKSENVLDFCAGWGGRLTGACALNIKKYIGIDINNALSEPYKKMTNYLKDVSTTNIHMIFQDALKVDYSTLDYDTAFTSPPYYFLEKYSNNEKYKSKKDMREEFYIPLFQKTYQYLKPGGVYILNINKEIYETICIELFGEAHESLPMKKSKRQNNYKEMIYVWRKHH
jgi:hypothetical protein